MPSPSSLVGFRYLRLGLGDTVHRGDEPGTMGDNLQPVDLGTGKSETTGIPSQMLQHIYQYIPSATKCLPCQVKLPLVNYKQFCKALFVPARFQRIHRSSGRSNSRGRGRGPISHLRYLG